MRRAAGAAIAAGLALAGCQKTAHQAATNAQAPAPAAATAPNGPVAASSPASVGGPRRKPGLWEMKVTSGGSVQTSRVCVDRATDETLGVTGVRRGAGPCRERVVMKTADGYRIDTVCDLGEAGTLTNHAVLTGDVGARYRVEMTTTTRGARAAQMNGTRRSTLEAAWQGPCPADMKPGDIEVGGVKFNAASAG